MLQTGSRQAILILPLLRQLQSQGIPLQDIAETIESKETRPVETCARRSRHCLTYRSCSCRAIKT